MSIYVVSDIHGDYDAFMNVLKQAGFSDDDKLYVLGDICDRGTDFYKIFTFIKDKPNIEMILGNHDVNLINFINEFRTMPIRTYKFCLSCAKMQDIKMFYMIQETIKSVAKECGEENVYKVLKNEVLPFLSNLKSYITLEVNDRKFLLVHAGIDYLLPLSEQTREICTRTREPFNHQDLPYYDYTIIHGHTITQELPSPKFDCRDLQIEGDGKKGEVLFWKHKISIDGGASKGDGRLNLLRLDDMKVFYCDSPKVYKQDLSTNMEL